ncbi:MAG TPA: hypothetical protein DIS79_10765 [Bacteroidetes bacterium]|nr:hypothetical protein [Bacteroidota bacterium]HRK04035.1 hypothetical protein [Chlorobiota bacterium]
MIRIVFGVLTCLALILVSCKDDPVTPPPPSPLPTFAEQVTAWNPRIIVVEPARPSNISRRFFRDTPGDTICRQIVRFQIDSENVADSIIWSIGKTTSTELSATFRDVPFGTNEVHAVVRKRFISNRENIDTVVERRLQRTFVSLDESHSLAIGKWVPIDPSEHFIDTLRVIYMGVIPGTQDSILRNFVLGATKGCDTTYLRKEMNMSLRRYAVNFERLATTLDCQDVVGELALFNRDEGEYRFIFSGSGGVQSIFVRRVE